MDELSEGSAGLTLVERVARLQAYLFREKVCGQWADQSEASALLPEEMRRCQADTDVYISSLEALALQSASRDAYSRVWDSWRDFNQWIDWTDWYLKPR